MQVGFLEHARQIQVKKGAKSWLPPFCFDLEAETVTMSTGAPFIGSKISLISKAEIRYEGILYQVDTKESTVTLAKGLESKVIIELLNMFFFSLS